MATANQPMEDAQVQEQDRSPSPAPPPPVAAAPGPRATALQKLYADAIAHVLKTCSYNNFASCFPTPAKEVPGSIKHLHEQFNDRLGSNMRTNFEDILTERNVVPSLNELDALIEDAKKRKAKAEEEANGQPVRAPIPPHALPAQQLYLSHLAPSLSQQSQSLQLRQNALQTENAEILQRVLQQRKEIEGIMQGLENVVADLDQSAAALKPEDIEELVNEAREVDEEIRTTV